MVPLYLSEMAPSKYRGAMNILFQLATTIGVLVAQLVNYGRPGCRGFVGLGCHFLCLRVEIRGMALMPCAFICSAAHPRVSACRTPGQRRACQ